MNKKNIAFGLMGLFTLALVSAAVVNYWGQTEVDMIVEDSFNVEEILCDFSVTAGDGSYELCEFAATNNLARDLNVDFELKVQKKIQGTFTDLDDDAGVYVGFSEDLQYAYDEAYGKCIDYECAEAWMIANPDWFDWDVLTQNYPEYYDTTIINGIGRTGYTPLTNGVLSIADQTIPANYELHGVIYVGSGLNLESGEYRVILDAVDVSEVLA